MNILNAKVLLTNMTDEIYLFTNFPCPFVKESLQSQPNLTLKFQATYDTGAEYVRNQFDIEPEIINLRH